MAACILLPAFNEAASIGDLIGRVRAVDKAYRIIVVDGGSRDGTVEIARRMGAEVIEFNVRGKAKAIKEAFSKIDEDSAVLLDSDKSYLPEEIPALLAALRGCDVVAGSRFIGTIEPGSMPGLNRFGNKALTFMANLLYGKKISDVCSGFWAFRKKAYKGIGIDSEHFELEANFYAYCAKRGLKLCEVPISYRAREGKTKLSPIHGIGIGWYLLKKRFFS
ncbi:glycosyltransferase family 2 protein [Candidatus Micrarchaeota archaeon]|nr:glycosyltransferase family 2 protein [Candidatus Micrarchaeota archaeon]